MKKGLIWGQGSPQEILTYENLSQVYDIPLPEVKRRREETATV
jgi:ABC-type cobalamin/Fe3+-siderophores transport system ATPase subunit